MPGTKPLYRASTPWLLCRVIRRGWSGQVRGRPGSRNVRRDWPSHRARRRSAHFPAYLAAQSGSDRLALAQTRFRAHSRPTEL